MATTSRPDPTFYPSPRLAMQAPPERFGYVATLRTDGKPDALQAVDLDAASQTYGAVIGKIELPNVGDELHHFGWNACSSMLCPLAGHPFVQRRYLIVPGLKSSRIYVIDVQSGPSKAKIVKVIEPDELARKTGYSRPHTVHCGPEGIFVTTMGGRGKDGMDGPAGVFLMDCETFDVIGPWEVDHGPQQLGYDFWWHMNQNIGVSSEWAKPPLFESGLQLDALLRHEYGHQLHFWDLKSHKHLQAVDLGENHQMVLELRPAHEPTRLYGFVGVVIDTTNLASSIWAWHRPNGQFQVKKIIEIPPEPAEADRLPAALKQFAAVPPLVSDIDLSLDDKYLYVSCWGLGELRQYDVSEPFAPKLAGTVRIGGIARRSPHPNGRAAQGGPQMVEISRDGKRVYFTNSLYSPWDPIFYPEGMAGWLAVANVNPDGGFALDPKLFVEFEDGYRAHQVRLEGGDCSTESFCFPSS